MNEQLKGSSYCRSLREGIYHVFSLEGSVYGSYENDLCPIYPRCNQVAQNKSDVQFIVKIYFKLFIYTYIHTHTVTHIYIYVRFLFVCFSFPF